MKIELNLDNISVNDYEDTVASILKSELDNAVRAEIRKLVKQYHTEIANKVAAAVKESIRNMSGDRITKIAKEMR